MNSNWGRFTVAGGAAVEAQIAELVRVVARRVTASLGVAPLRALLLIGGYGRGEGGVLAERGVERPHNNLDFLLVTKGWRAPRGLAEKLRLDLQAVQRERQIGIDSSVISANRLRHSASLVMWYDLRHGHKTILGDPGFAAGLTRFRADRIPVGDVRGLLVNRGALLILNRWLWRHSEDVRLRRSIVKHLAKAVIGYGDALLYSAGEYHWSYREKQRRMRNCRLAGEAFRRLYNSAVEFRFAPDYAACDHCDLQDWQDRVTQQLEQVHLEFEASRLGWLGPVDWSAGADAALRREGRLAGGWRRRIGALLAPFGPLVPVAPARRHSAFSRRERRAARRAGRLGRLRLAFPIIAYEVEERYGWAQELLGAVDAGLAALEDAFIREWGVCGDTNFAISDTGGAFQAPSFRLAPSGAPAEPAGLFHSVHFARNLEPLT